MIWLEQKTTIYQNNKDVIGEQTTIEKILFSGFEKNLPHIIELRKLNVNAPDYKTQKDAFKTKLQTYTPSALLASRQKNNIIEINRTGLLQLDFDYSDIKQYNIEKLKQALFKLPFIAYCGLSCTGKGFYALAQITEPERLQEYAQHCFKIFKEKYGIRVDPSKGGNVAHLRYISYDCNMLVREQPCILHIPKPQPVIKKQKKIIYTGDFDPFKHAIKTAETKAGGTFQHGSNGHRFIFYLCCSLKGLNVPISETENWIDKNLIPLKEIKSNCIKAAYK